MEYIFYYWITTTILMAGYMHATGDNDFMPLCFFGWLAVPIWIVSSIFNLLGVKGTQP